MTNPYAYEDQQIMNYEYDDVIMAHKTVSLNPNLILIVDQVSASTIYIGQAIPGSEIASSVWQIQKITVSGVLTSTLFADGNTRYDNVWANRASLNYS
jgi:hypothetical protein